MRAALKTASLVEATGQAIATLDFQGPIVQLLRETANPTPMQKSFLRIVDIIEEYKVRGARGMCCDGAEGGGANAETTPAGAPAAAANRTQRPNTCEGKTG